MEKTNELIAQLKLAVSLLVSMRDGDFSDSDWRDVDDLEEYVNAIHTEKA